MKKHLHNNGDVLISLVIIACLFISSSSLSSFMPSSLVMISIALFAAAFSAFAVLIWKEQPRDERESHIMLNADRFGFLAGASVLSIAVIIQALRHQPTNILIGCLTVMILTKIIYTRANK